MTDTASPACAGRCANRAEFAVYRARSFSGRPVLCCAAHCPALGAGVGSGVVTMVTRLGALAPDDRAKVVASGAPSRVVPTPRRSS
jgi:hypothetical protein